MPVAPKKPTDMTGRLREEAAAAHAEEQAERAAEMSMASAQKQNQLNETIDATVPNRATVIVDNPVEISTEEDSVTIRVIADIENMTLGVGNIYTFKAGQKYKVSKNVATHLEEKGYLAGVF
jgi:sRNA-binding protein